MNPWQEPICLGERLDCQIGGIGEKDLRRGSHIALTGIKVRGEVQDRLDRLYL